MSFQDKALIKIIELLGRSDSLSIGNENDQCTDSKQSAACTAWLISAQNSVHLIFKNPNSPYRSKIDQIASKAHGFIIHRYVQQAASILSSLIEDARSGLIVSLENQVVAATFEDFLSHADFYIKKDKKNEAGTITGVVFEDTIRRICRNFSIPEKDINLELLIAELVKIDAFTEAQAKWARAAAHVRTKATHAQWDEFSRKDVERAIDITRELIREKIDA